MKSISKKKNVQYNYIRY